MNTTLTIILVVAAITGFWKGAVKMGAHFAGTIIGMILAYLYYKEVGEFIAPYVGSSSSLLAFPIIAIIVPVAFGVLGTLLTKILGAVHLGLLNRLLGAAIAVVCYGGIYLFVKFIMSLLH